MDGIHREIHLAAPVARVWGFLTEPGKVARWLMDSDIEAVEGGRFRFTCEPSGGWDGVIRCQVKEVIEHERLSYTWNANDIGAETLVTFELEAASDGTRLILTHTRFQGALPGAEGRHAAGWYNVLNALRTTLTGPEDGYDWSSFQITSFFDEPVAEVYRRWATAGGMRSFWADRVVCVDPDGAARSPEATYRTGDQIELTFPTEQSTRLRILNLEEDRSFSSSSARATAGCRSRSRRWADGPAWSCASSGFRTTTSRTGRSMPTPADGGSSISSI